METPYTPINCHLYDQLEIYAMHRDILDISIRLVGGEKRELSTRINDLYVRDGVEYVFLETGEEIRMDHLVSVQKAT